jgi:hypothetical protein
MRRIDALLRAREPRPLEPPFELHPERRLESRRAGARQFQVDQEDESVGAAEAEPARRSKSSRPPIRERRSRSGPSRPEPALTTLGASRLVALVACPIAG